MVSSNLVYYNASMSFSPKIRIILSCLSGNILEWFDFAVYGYLAPIIAGQFFPSSHKLTSILLTYSVFAIGFLVRPLGAIIFGHMGDTLGRKKVLIVSSIAMAIPTFLMGLLPVYASVGWWAPFLLIICRIFQGLSIGGEFTGSFIYLVEQATENRRGFFSCWSDVGCNLGMILGSACVALLNFGLTTEQLARFGWRLPFLCGILLAVLAVGMRSQLSESIAFLRITKTHQSPVKQVIHQYPQVLILSILLIAINSLGFYILVVFIPNQTVLLGKLPAEQVYWINIFTLATVMCATFLAACACDYVDKTKIYLSGIIGCILLSYPAFYALSHFSLIGQIGMSLLMAVAIGCCYGPRPLFMVETFTPNVRNSAIAIAFNVGNGIFGGMGPLLATYLVAKTGMIEIPSVLVIVAAFFTLFAILKLSKTEYAIPTAE